MRSNRTNCRDGCNPSLMGPAKAWSLLQEGNIRFLKRIAHAPGAEMAAIAKLSAGQHPTVALFGCSDSRVSAEIIFDQGLGEMFVVRSAGHTVDSSVLGSLEYAVEVLGVPLIAILGHDSCGAIAATVEALNSGRLPGGYVRDIVEKLTPSILNAQSDGFESTYSFEVHHVVETARLIYQRSELIRRQIESGKVSIACLSYRLAEGRVDCHRMFGSGLTGAAGGSVHDDGF